MRAWALVFTWAVLADTAAFAGEVGEYDEVSVSPPPDTAMKTVSVENDLGSVVIVGHDSDEVVVRARKRAPDADTLQRLSVALTPAASGVLEVRTELLSGLEQTIARAGSVGVDLEIAVPRHVRPSVKVWKGHVRVEQIDNGAEVLANEANVDFRQVSGRIRSHSTLGRQQFRELVQVTLESLALEGDLAFRDVQGDALTAFTHRGEISATGLVVRKLNLRTFRGPIRLVGVLAKDGHYDIASVHGDIEFSFADIRNTPAVVIAESDAGHLLLPDGFDRQVVSVTPGTPRVALRSRLGDVRVSIIQGLAPL